MPTLRFARFETALGPTWVVETDLGIAAVSRSEPFGALERRFPRSSVEPADLDGSWIDRALTGGPLPPIDVRGLSPFDARAYEVVRGVPPGETVTYGEVAALIGSPGAARAVGGAMSRCPLFPAVPCHRVVRAADGWSGWGSDPAVKRRLLAAERNAGASG
jgi:O-6-methylguanine DNA methyltransferase